MFQPERTLCLLLWMAGLSTSPGEVIAPASLTAEVGRPLVLACNITTAAGDAVRQVRWLDQHSRLLLAYEQRVPVRVSHRHPGVLLTASHGDASSITIEAVRGNDGGCYRCVFDVFPSGTQEGSTCVSVTGTVHLEGNRTAVSGRPLTLSCSYSLPERVRQVLWRKTAEQGDTATVASYTKHGHHHVEAEFKGHVDLSRTLGDTQLSVRVVKTEDEACYTCEFHTFPDGARSARACLSVYVLPKPEVTQVTTPSGVTEATCTAQSRPAADVTWDVNGDNRTLGPPVLSVSDQGDGTTIVSSTLLFQSEPNGELSAKCVVQHQGLDKPVTLFLHSPVDPVTVILLSVCGVAAVLLLGLCACLCKCFICTNVAGRMQSRIVLVDVDAARSAVLRPVTRVRHDPGRGCTVRQARSVCGGGSLRRSGRSLPRHTTMRTTAKSSTKVARYAREYNTGGQSAGRTGDICPSGFFRTNSQGGIKPVITFTSMN